jgi:glycosyltransferase involved in cell wall biosynthesis
VQKGNNISMIKSLFLAAWYPNRYDAMLGLFVKKHAQAVALYCNVCVLYFHPDINISKTEIVRSKSDNISEIIIYFPDNKTGALKRFSKLINYLIAVITGFSIYFKEFGKPDIIHVNILTRTGIPALFLKYFQKIPYLITEHWTRYLPENNSFNGFLRKKITQLIVKNASFVMPVSNQLKIAMQNHGIHSNGYRIVNNVVDSFFYELNDKNPTGKIRKILLVSCFLEQAKNVKGLLRSIKSLSHKRTDFQLTIVGDGPDFKKTYQYFTDLKFSENLITFTGEKRPEEVAGYYAEADFFILFSNYETAGIVIAESLASGIPVISTKVGIAPDFINDETGLLVDVGDEKGFTRAIDYMLDHLVDYKSEKIKNYGKVFSFEGVGREIYDLYKESLNYKRN